MNQIIPHLYISDWYFSNNIFELEKNNIKAVLTLETRPKPDSIIKYYNNKNIDFLYIPIHDSPQEYIFKYFDLTYDFIKKHIDRGENVLVHCWAGVSRSSIIILNYLVRNAIQMNNNSCNKCVIKNCLDYMKAKRSIVNPNIGFINQLINYSKFYY